MKYCLKVYYSTGVLDKVSGWMRQIMDDWKQGDKRLEMCQTFDFETDEPLHPEVIEKLKSLKEDWMTEVVLEEVHA